MKLEETENLKLQYVNRIETSTTQINNIHDSDVDLTEKITEILNLYEKNPNFKGKTSFKKWCNYCRRYGHSFAECRQKQQDNQNKSQKYKEPNKSFYQYMKKKIKIYQRKIYIVITALVNHSQIIQTTQEINHPITLIIEVDHQNKEIHEISQSQIVDQIANKTSIKITIHDQIQTIEKFLIPVSIQILEIDTIQT